MANLSEHTQFENEQALIEANRNPDADQAVCVTPSEAPIVPDKSDDLARHNESMARFRSDSGKAKIRTYASAAMLRAKARDDASTELLKIIGEFYPPVKLEIWFKYDAWTPEEAMPLLCGFCQSFKFSGRSGIAMGDYVRLDGITPEDEDAMSFPRNLIDQIRAKFEVDCAALLQLWGSGSMGSGRRPPGDFIDWALRKGERIDWLKWAIEHGYYSDGNEVTKRRISSDEEIPAPANERNNLLLIATGLMGALGIDHTDIHAASTIERHIDRYCGAKYAAPTIRTKLDMIPQMLERRRK